MHRQNPQTRKNLFRSLAFLLIPILFSCALFLTYVAVDWNADNETSGSFFAEPSAVATDENDNVFVADIWQSVIQKYDSEGNFIKQWHYPPGSDNDDNFRPAGIAIDSASDLYVTDCLNNRVQVFDDNGTFIFTWGSEGNTTGQFRYPVGIAIDSADNIYVADTGNNRIQKFDQSGTYITGWGDTGNTDGKFDGPFAVAVSIDDEVFVADTYNHRVQKFETDGSFIKAWGTRGSDDGEFYGPGGIAVDDQGHVYVCDTQRNRMQKFDSGGTHLMTWGKLGEATGKMDGPIGASIDTKGNVYLVDAKNGRIQKFALGFPSASEEEKENLCEVWEGTWDVLYTDNSTYEWTLDNAVLRDSTMFPCMVDGVSKDEAENEVAFKIYWAEGMGRQFMYTENIGELSMTHPATFIDLSGSSFTTDSENGYGYDFPIVSGNKEIM